MSVSKWKYTPACDGKPCPGDCDSCGWEPDEAGDLISRQEAIEVPEKFIKDCNPEHFVGHQKFIEYMDNAEIGSFGSWQFANGFNMGLTAAEVAIKQLPSAQPGQKKGHWIEQYAFIGDSDPTYTCSKCGGHVFQYRPGRFCKWCGADMRGETE